LLCVVLARPEIVVPAGGLRRPRTAESAIAVEDESGNVRSADNLYMNGAEIFNFTVNAVPKSVDALLKRALLSRSDIDLCIPPG